MACLKARCNSLTSIWYSVIVVALQAYLLYLGIERYKLYTGMKWPIGGYPSQWLAIYASLHAACLPLLFLQLAFGLFKTGNLGGDGDRLADREERIIELKPDKHGEKQGCAHCLKSLWQHLPPLPQQLHVISALCIVVAQQLLVAQLYRHGFINSGDFLNTEMDFLFHRARQLATNLPMGDTRLQGFRITADELSGSPLAANLLPLLMHVRLFGIPLEFVNMLLALIAYSIAYPSIFWRVSKPFALIFSLHLLIYSGCLIFSYLSFTVFLRVQETNAYNIRPIGLGHYVGRTHYYWVNDYVYHPYGIIVAFLTSTIFTSLAPITLYAYGYGKYFVGVMYGQAKNTVRGSSQGGHSEYSTHRSRAGAERQQSSSSFCCEGYVPHVIAIALLIFVAVFKAPNIYTILLIVQHEPQPLLLVCLAFELIYLFSWILLWLALTLKKKWNFKIAHRAHELYALQKGLTYGHVKVNTNPSQLKNALLLVHKDHMFVTDDQHAKQTLLRAIQQNSLDGAALKDESYWVKVNGGGGGGGGQGSPGPRKLQIDSSGTVRETPEMSRLLNSTSTRRPSIDDNVTYHSVTRSMLQSQQAPPMLSVAYRGKSSPPDEMPNSFGTLQRNQQAAYMSTLQRHASAGNAGGIPGHNGTLQRTMNHSSNQWPPPPLPHDSYASIHKAKEQQPVIATTTSSSMYTRRGSHDDPANPYGTHHHHSQSAYGTVGGGASAYGTYARISQQSRIASSLQQQPNGGQVIRSNGNNTYMSSDKLGLRRPNSEQQQQPSVTVIGAIRNSPLMGERERTARFAGLPQPEPFRDTSAYQPGSSSLKLSSFNNGCGGASSHMNDFKNGGGLATNVGGGGYGTIGGGQKWGQSSSSQNQHHGYGMGSILSNGGAPPAKPPLMTMPSSGSGGGGVPSAMTPLSSSSSAHDIAASSFTPTSTLTSQGSATYSASRTPTRGGSPAHSTAGTSSFGRGTCTMNGSGCDDDDVIDCGGTLQRGGGGGSNAPLPLAPPKPPQVSTGSTSIRHNVKVIGVPPPITTISISGGGSTTGTRNDDSANFSLASSNGSNTTQPGGNDYATSIV